MQWEVNASFTRVTRLGFRSYKSFISRTICNVSLLYIVDPFVGLVEPWSGFTFIAKSMCIYFSAYYIDCGDYI